MNVGNLADTCRSHRHVGRQHPTQRRRWRFPVERPVRTCKRSLAKQGLKAEPGDSGHSRVASADPDKFEGEWLHLAVANWRCRP